MKTLEELRKMELKALFAELAEEDKAHFKVKYEVASGQARNIHDIKKHKKQRARIKTIITEKQIMEVNTPKPEKKESKEDSK